MVAHKKDLENIHFSTLALTSTIIHMAFIPASKIININNYNNTRERTSSPSKASFRSVSSQFYYEKIVLNNNLSNKEFRELVNNSQLSYKDNSKERNLIRKITDYKFTNIMT